MKILRTFVFIVAALIIGFISARWCTASQKTTPDSYFGLHQLESFVAYLQDSGQTNTLKRFEDYLNAATILQSTAGLGMKLSVLHMLRAGRTNQAISMLESSMVADAVGLAVGFKELPASLRPQVDLRLLKKAQDYREKFQMTNSAAEIDEMIMEAFRLQEETSAK